MTIRVYQPRCSVLLHKTISRKQTADGAPVSRRFQGSTRVIDLTQHLGASGGVQTAKSVREPAGGFSVVLVDRPNVQGSSLESLYGLIEPMDFVEIRMLHDAKAGQAPIIMRGFVSTVSRDEVVDGDGRPTRTVTITGQDYGKLWQQMQIIYRPGYIIGQDVLSNFKLFERFGAGFQTNMKAADFVSEIVKKVLNPYVKGLMPENTTNPAEVKLDLQVAHGTTSVSGPQNQEGSIYQLLRRYGDVGIWNELFIEDREDGVYCVYRPNPYKSVDGKRIFSDGKDATVVDLPREDVEAINVSRSDSNVANYYWVRAPRFELNSEYWRKVGAIKNDKQTVDLSEHENSAAKLYGVRLMEVDTEQGGDDVTSFNSGQDKDQQNRRDTSMVNWLNDRRRLLVEQNKDNVVLESGRLRVRGNENIRPGCIVRLIRGGFQAEYYVVQVNHEFSPFQDFKTTLQVERGTGFAERAKREGGPDSPYLAEIRGLR